MSFQFRSGRMAKGFALIFSPCVQAPLCEPAEKHKLVLANAGPTGAVTFATLPSSDWRN
jgi:hypothetical protein